MNGKLNNLNFKRRFMRKTIISSAFYRVLQSVAECRRVLQSDTECCRVLESVTECYFFYDIIFNIFSTETCFIPYPQNIEPTSFAVYNIILFISYPQNNAVEMLS